MTATLFLRPTGYPVDGKEACLEVRSYDKRHIGGKKGGKARAKALPPSSFSRCFRTKRRPGPTSKAAFGRKAPSARCAA